MIAVVKEAATRHDFRVGLELLFPVTAYSVL
jgi:hypothetical protein